MKLNQEMDYRYIHELRGEQLDMALNERITEILDGLYISKRTKGYILLQRALKLLVLEPENMYGITKRVFERIAPEAGTTPQCAECTIRQTIYDAWIYGNPCMQHQYFGRTITFGSNGPTPAEFLAAIAWRVRLEFDLDHKSLRQLAGVKA